MPAQTTLRNKMRVADGTRVMIKVEDESVYTDLGVVLGDVDITLNWDEFQEESNNAGKSDMIAKNPTATGSFNLQQLDMDNISRLASGLMEKVTTTAAATSAIPDQVFAVGWAAGERYPIVAYTSTSDDTKLKLSTAPVFDAVTLDLGGTPEVLGAGTDYVISEDSEAVSGYSIQFIPGNMSTISPLTFAITAEFGSNTPVSRETFHIGTSTKTLVSFSLKLEHTDSAGLVYGNEIHKCFSNSGSIVYMFKSAAESGHNEMPIAFTGVLDTSLTDGRQLMSSYSDVGAV